MEYLDKLYFYINQKIYMLFSDINITDIEGSTGGGTFSNVVDSVTKVSQDLYYTLMIIGAFGGVLMLILGFIFLGVAGNGQKKDDAKSTIGRVLLAVAGIFAAVFIVGLAQSVGKALAGQGGTK